MISITCTSCQAQLSIDDAFAGGVCRCQFCGAIQTVPSKNARPARQAAPGAKSQAVMSSAGQKTLYTKKTSVPEEPSGLNNLADVVASSGLTGSGLRAGHNRLKAQSASSPATKNLMPILIGAGAMILVLVGLVIFLVMHSRSSDNKTNASDGGQSSTADNSANATGPKAVTPAFLGTPIPEPVVIYVLDRGQATRATFDYAKLAVLKSVGTLRPDQKFQVILWKTKEPLVVYPPAGPAEVSADALEGCRRTIDAIGAYDISDVKPAIERAMKGYPGVIVIASGKLLGEDFTKSVLDAKKTVQVHIDCFSLDEPGSAASMKVVAQKTGGTYRDVPKEELITSVR